MICPEIMFPVGVLEWTDRCTSQRDMTSHYLQQQGATKNEANFGVPVEFLLLKTQDIGLGSLADPGGPGSPAPCPPRLVQNHAVFRQFKANFGLRAPQVSNSWIRPWGYSVWMRHCKKSSPGKSPLLHFRAVLLKTQTGLRKQSSPGTPKRPQGTRLHFTL